MIFRNRRSKTKLLYLPSCLTKDWSPLKTRIVARINQLVSLGVLMAVNLLPSVNGAPFMDSSGNPLSGGKIYAYTAGSSTPQDTFTTYLGNVANANPIILDSGGYPATGGSVVEVWGTAGVSYKLVLATSADVIVWTRDRLVGINDTTVTIDEWVSGAAPTYISATSFSLVGDQISTYQVGRRIKTTNTAGTIYSTITVSAFGAVTTVTVVNDSGVLDSGLSAVSYALLSSLNPSDPRSVGVTVAAHATTSNVWASEQVTLTGGAVTFTDIADAPYVGAVAWVKQNAAHVWTNGAVFAVQGLANYTAIADDWVRIYATTVSTFEVTIFKKSGAPSSMLPVTNSLSGDVALNNTSNFFTGPTVAQGTAGTWFASGHVLVKDTAGAANFIIKLWDGTTVIDSAAVGTTGASTLTNVELSGYLASPAGNIRISVKDVTATTGVIVFNASGESKDGTLTAIRIA